MRVRRKFAAFPTLMLALSGITVMSLPESAHAAAQDDIRITEWEYNGSEFVELTNVGTENHDLTGWSFSDSARAPGDVSLSAFGTVGTLAVPTRSTSSTPQARWLTA